MNRRTPGGSNLQTLATHQATRQTTRQTCTARRATDPGSDDGDGGDGDDYELSEVYEANMGHPCR